jgi:hypothetical protein
LAKFGYYVGGLGIFRRFKVFSAGSQGFSAGSNGFLSVQRYFLSVQNVFRRFKNRLTDWRRRRLRLHLE